ncbi:nucleotidyltransferase family protein [Vallitalea pronyensis]|uniref:Nucleotidyltransferase family protein n=1 Tax=Vallitalea pronyensis TaxID=1348613 RepID=A0A8J8ML31_9FIRM|nr:nucleotidyltransferase family protein [Vallitalea pronyensis]QUI23491.1 nucleotidyltransferase family protein [Vallitalea pronyensis]
MIQVIILAAGSSKRFGENKLGKHLQGKPILHHVFDVALEVRQMKPIVVYYHQDVLHDAYNEQMLYVYNPHAPQGMSTSVKCGLLHAPKVDAYMFMNGDQPLITVKLVEKLIEAYNQGRGSIIVPKYKGKRGNPTIFDYKWREKLLQVTGDKGGRDFIINYPKEVHYVDIENQYMGMDMDTQEDYKVLKELKRHE